MNSHPLLIFWISIMDGFFRIAEPGLGTLYSRYITHPFVPVWSQGLLEKMATGIFHLMYRVAIWRRWGIDSPQVHFWWGLWCRGRVGQVFSGSGWGRCWAHASRTRIARGYASSGWWGSRNGSRGISGHNAPRLELTIGPGVGKRERLQCKGKEYMQEVWDVSLVYITSQIGVV